MTFPALAQAEGHDFFHTSYPSQLLDLAESQI